MDTGKTLFAARVQIAFGARTPAAYMHFDKITDRTNCRSLKWTRWSAPLACLPTKACRCGLPT